MDVYLAALGLPPCEFEPAGFMSLPLTSAGDIGVQWQPGGAALLFANVGHVKSRLAGSHPRDELDVDSDDDDDEGDEEVDLGTDEHGRWSLHINGQTALSTLCLHDTAAHP